MNEFRYKVENAVVLAHTAQVAVENTSALFSNTNPSFFQCLSPMIADLYFFTAHRSTEQIDPDPRINDSPAVSCT